MFLRLCRGHLSQYSLETFHFNYSQSPYNGFQKLIDLLPPPCTLTLSLFPYELCSYHTGLLTMPPTPDMFLPPILGVAILPASNQFRLSPRFSPSGILGLLILTLRATPASMSTVDPGPYTLPHSQHSVLSILFVLCTIIEHIIYLTIWLAIVYLSQLKLSFFRTGCLLLFCSLLYF